MPMQVLATPKASRLLIIGLLILLLGISKIREWTSPASVDTQLSKVSS